HIENNKEWQIVIDGIENFVNDLKVISDKPYTKCSYSRVISDLTSANDLISVHASVPRILHPHRQTSFKIIQISSSICEYSQFKPYHIPSGNSANYIVFHEINLYSRSSLLYFGTISRQSGSFSIRSKFCSSVINLLKS
ncbi:hypothetical protein EWB00_001327, partial [Schistosoma japonicum]